jgi:hypothetical protein
MSQRHSGTAVGFTVFASVMLLLAGIFQFLAGLSGVIKDDSTIYAATADTTYAFSFNTAGWGWAHMLVGVVVFLAAIGLMFGQVWARTVGVLMAAVSAITNFVFIPVYPWWSITMIALCVAVIWALTLHGRDIEAV